MHAILQTGPLVHYVQVRLNDSIGLIDDMDENLAMLDLKMRHMREDIAAKEARNNRYISWCHSWHQVSCCKATLRGKLYMTSQCRECAQLSALIVLVCN